MSTVTKRTGRRGQGKKTVASVATEKAKPVEAVSPEEQTLTFPQALDLAVGHHVAGRLAEAANIYRQILNADPDQPAALHLLGMVNHAGGQSGVAVELIQRALVAEPEYVKAHYNLGVVYSDLGKLDDGLITGQTGCIHLIVVNNIAEGLQFLW